MPVSGLRGIGGAGAFLFTRQDQPPAPALFGFDAVSEKPRYLFYGTLQPERAGAAVCKSCFIHASCRTNTGHFYEAVLFRIVVARHFGVTRRASIPDLQMHHTRLHGHDIAHVLATGFTSPRGHSRVMLVARVQRHGGLAGASIRLSSMPPQAVCLGLVK
jgi:hypothetical protein